MMKLLPDKGKTYGRNLLLAAVLFTLAAIVPVGTAFAQTPAPATTNQGISAKFSNATVKEVLTYLDNHTQYDFVYNDNQIAGLPRVSIQRESATVLEIVKFCLRNSNLSYQVKGNLIVIKPKAEIGEATSVAMKLQGTVTDDEGNPMVGVAVVGVGTGRGAVTGTNGEFVLTIRQAPNLELSFSFIGMKDYTLTIMRDGKLAVSDPLKLRVAMEPSVSKINDVVVTGVVNLSRKSFTGSSTTITGDELKRVSPTGVLQAAQIFDPSFRLAENLNMGSNPNAIPEMYIRGRSGIGTPELDASTISESSLNNNPNLPIFIMDGYEVPVSKIFDLDVERVETYTILKDAAATAMYGSRAANGVVVITTVPPKVGRLNVTYAGNVTVNAPDLSSYNLMDAREKLETERLAGLYTADNFESQAQLDKTYNQKLQNIEKGINTDWTGLPLRTSISHKHSLYLEGGSREFRYGIDMRYEDQQGVMKGQSREKMGLGFTLQYNYKKLSFRNQATADVVTGKESPYGSYSDYIRMNPYDTYLDENGNISKDMTNWHGSNTDYRNPMYDATLGSYDKTKYKEFYDNFDFRWYATKKVYFKANIALSYKVEDKNKFKDPDSSGYDGKPIEQKGSLTSSTRQSFSYDLNVNGYYNDQIGKHSLNLVAGINLKQDDMDYRSYTYTGFPTGGYSAPGYANDMTSDTYSEERSRLFGALAVFNYTFDNIYLFDVSGRLDGSSQFGTNKRFAPFYATGAGINIHNYKAVKAAAPWLSQFKIRATYGMTGKVNFPSYAAQNRYFVVKDEWYITGDGVKIRYLGNPNLKWERTNQMDIGTEITILDGLFYAKYSYYIKDTKDLIADIFIPSSSGFTTYKENVGSVENRGHEISLRSRIVNTKSTQIYLFANGAHNKNKLKEISNAMKTYNSRVEAEYANNKRTTPLTKYYEGNSQTAIYAMPSLGIDPANGRELFLHKDGTVSYDWIASDNIVVGDTEPTMSGSFGFSFNWKGLSLDTYFMYEWGGQKYNTTLLNTIEGADIRNSNCDRRVLSDRWQKPGDVTKYRNIADWDDPTLPTTRFVQDYNNLHLSSLSLGYEFNRKAIEKLGLRRLKLQFNMQDVFTVSSIRIERGLTTPFARTFTLSVNASF